jgi:hypothetical protein
MGAMAEAEQQIRAARLVAGHSLDVNDCRELLSMLGLAVPSTNRSPAPHTRPYPSADDQRPSLPRATANTFHSIEGTRE